MNGKAERHIDGEPLEQPEPLERNGQPDVDGTDRRRGQRPRRRLSAPTRVIGEEQRPAPKLLVEELSASFGRRCVLKSLDLTVDEQRVTAVIGPSGCGKSTFIRCLNRMHELDPGGRVEGRVFLDDQDIYARDVDPALLRRRIGMIFAQPNPFPSMSVRDNVLAGLRLTGRLERREADGVVERALREAGLWDEVADKLRSRAVDLPIGQQQRLCIARALAVGPEVLLMDEPCSVLDPAATARVEDLIESLSGRYTIVIVTHNMQQAARVSDRTAFLLDGELVESASTEMLFTAPHDPRTEDYITGKFG